MKTYVIPIALILALAKVACGEVTIFTYTSSLTSEVAGGSYATVTPDQGFEFLAYHVSGYGDVQFTIHSSDWSRFWILHFEAPYGALPTVGSYPDALCWPWENLNTPSAPGLSFFGPTGTSVDRITGYFNILEARYAPDNSIIAFAVDFVQYDLGEVARWSQGSLRFNSVVPVPEPSQFNFVLLGIAVLLWAIAERDKKKSAPKLRWTLYR